jgi:hypothetical protein
MVTMAFSFKKKTHLYWNYFRLDSHPCHVCCNRLVVFFVTDCEFIIYRIYLIENFLLGLRMFKNPQPPVAYFSVNDTSLKGPIVPEIISSTLATIINTVLPGVVMILLELIFFYDFWELYHLLTGHISAVGKESENYNFVYYCAILIFNGY